MGKIDGVWQIETTAWLPADGLGDKSQRDKVPYDLWARQGKLLTTPGPSIDYTFIAKYLFDVIAKCNVVKIGFFSAW